MLTLQGTNGNEVPVPDRSGSVPIYGAIRNWVKRVPGDGPYTATEVLGIWVGTVPSADNTSITPIGGSQDDAVVKELFVAGEIYPVHASRVVVGTGGVFYLIIPDA